MDSFIQAFSHSSILPFTHSRIFLIASWSLSQRFVAALMKEDVYVISVTKYPEQIEQTVTVY